MLVYTVCRALSLLLLPVVKFPSSLSAETTISQPLHSFFMNSLLCLGWFLQNWKLPDVSASPPN